jgi:hypothetical protein
VKVTIVDEPPAAPVKDDWLESLHRMAAGGVRITRPVDDSRGSIYEGTE